MHLARTFFKNVSKCFLVLVSLVSVNQESEAVEPPWAGMQVGTSLSVTLSTGRVVHGKLDSHSTNEHLRLTLENEGMSVSSLVHRDDVKSMQLEDPKLQATLSQAKSTALVQAPVAQIHQADTTNGKTLAKSLAVFAQIDNWNGDSKSDGLRVYLRPTGANGEVVQVSGTVSVHLNVYRGDVRNTAGRFHEEESWSYELSKNNYDQTGATITLPFRRIQPDSDHEIYALGTLNVRLKISGQGVLDATLDDVELRKRSITSDLRRRR